MRRSAGQAHEIRPILPFVTNFAAHYFPANLCGHLTIRGVIDVDITIIRSWLGHVSLDTTNHYAKANLETKRKALELVGVPTKGGHRPSWKRDASLLAWLDTL